MLINAWGNIVQECWYDLPNNHPGLELDIFVVIPNTNHMHGIIELAYERAGCRKARIFAVLRLKPAPTESTTELSITKLH